MSTMENENRKYARTTPAQLRSFISFIRSHPELLQGKNCPTSPNCLKQLWQEVAENLNSMLGPTRTPDSWKEALRNWRKQLQARARKVINERNRTGGGQNLELELSEFEKQALEVFGLAAVEGHSGVTLGFGVLTDIANNQQLAAESSLAPIPVCCTNSYETVATVNNPNAEVPEPNPYEAIPAATNNTAATETRRGTKTFREAVIDLVQQDMKERREEQEKLARSLEGIANGIACIADAVKDLVTLQRQMM